MSTKVLFRSEVLFYVQNNAASETVEGLVSTLMFFTEDELVEAKNALFAVAASTNLSCDVLPTLKSRRGEM